MIDYNELARELQTQDNRSEQYPLFVVQQRDRIYGLDSDYADRLTWVCTEEFEDIGDSTALAKWVTDNDIDDDYLEEYVNRVYYVDRWAFVTAHLTRKAAQRYIDENQHNLTDPRIFVTSQYRCHEFNAVLEDLKAGRLQRRPE